MKKILQNSVTIIAEILIFILALIWYLNMKEIEPLIVIIGSIAFFLMSIISFYIKETAIRPKIVFHHKGDFYSRSPNGYSPKNKRVVEIGVDDLIQFWELKWSYDVEIRNNSSVTAYDISIQYENIPSFTRIDGEIGKIQPIKTDDVIFFNFKIFKNIEGTLEEADRILEEEPLLFMKDMNIIVVYKDEKGMSFKTSYNWLLDSNNFK